MPGKSKECATVWQEAKGNVSREMWQRHRFAKGYSWLCRRGDCFESFLIFLETGAATVGLPLLLAGFAH
jgi:hypothetical protein